MNPASADRWAMVHPGVKPRGRVWMGWARALGAAIVTGALHSWAAENAEFGPSADPPELDYRQRVWTREHGLPDARVLSLLRSRDGFLWIGTGDGLARFDGRRFTVFDRSTHPELPNLEIRVLSEALDGALWVGTGRGLLSLTPRPFVRFSAVPVAADQSIRALCASRRGELWIGTEAGLFRYRSNVAERVELAALAAIPEQTVLGLAEDSSGTIWVASRHGLCRQERSGDRESLTHVGPPWPDGSLEYGNAERIALGPPGLLWFLGRGLHLLRNETVETLAPAPAIPNDHTLALLVDREQRAWMGYERAGLVRWRRGALDRFTTGSGLPDTWVNCLLEDRDANLWIGTERGGLVCWQPRPFAHLTRKTGLPDDNVWCLATAAAGGVWIGTDEGVALWTEAAGAATPPGLILSSSKVRALHEAADGTLWIGTGDSLEIWRHGRVAVVRWEGETSANKVRTIISDRHGTVWVGRESGLMRFRNGQWMRFTTADGLPHADIRALRSDRDGRLWLGTFGGGLCRLDPNPTPPAVETTLRAADGLPSDFVWTLHEDDDGVVWAGTERGLCRVARNPDAPGTPARLHLTAFTRHHGLPSDEVNEILEDAQGRLWLSSDHGICSISKRQLDRVAAGASAEVEPMRYTDADGLLSQETNGQKSQPAGCRTPDGRLWFPTTRGVAIIDPRSLASPRDEPGLPATSTTVSRGSPLPDGFTASGHLPIAPSPSEGPLAVLERIRVDDEDLLDLASPRGLGALEASPPDRGRHSNRLAIRPTAVEGTADCSGLAPISFELPAGRGRALEVHYTAPSFRAADQLRFRHRLLGLDRHWVEAGTRRTAFYANLRPGRYRFEVQAAENLNRWGPLSPAVEFRLAPHVHQTLWFWPAVVSGLAMAMAAVGSWRIREVRRLHACERATALADERERIARDMHDDLGARLNHLALLSDPTVSPGAPPRVADLAREAVQCLDAIVWTTKPSKDSLPELASYLAQTAHEHLSAAGLALDIQLPSQIPPWPLSAIERQHLFLICREALHNTVRHAGASRVTLRLRLARQGFALELEDDGRGFRPAEAESHGNGLAHMRARASAISARFEIASAPSLGTRITLELAGSAQWR